VNPTIQRVSAAIFRPFSKVEPREVATLAIMTCASFLLLTAYYLLKTVREPLILLQGGAEVKLYARAAQTIIMVGVVWLYGELARRVGRMKLLAHVFMFFMSNLAVFAVLATTNLQIGLAFFLWVGVFSYTVVAQFWGLAADIYTEEQGKRLFPIIGAGSSIGAVAGARLAKAIVPLGPPALMAASLVILVVCVAMIVWVERRHMAVKVHHEDKHPDTPLSTESAFHLLARDKYLMLIAGLVVLLNWVNSSGEYLLDRTLVAAAHEAGGPLAAETAFIGAFKADYYAWYNSIGLLLQLFAVSRIFKLVGVRNALFFMPIFAFGAYGMAALFPVLAVVRLVKIGENGMQYSLQETTRHALFLVTSRVEKFVGKTAVDTVAVRCGSIMSAIMVMIGTHYGWSTRTFASLNVALAGAWIVAAYFVSREHKRRSEEPEQEIAKEPISLHALQLDAAAAPISRLTPQSK
jgi:AAA family ATP:ADP antiporter